MVGGMLQGVLRRRDHRCAVTALKNWQDSRTGKREGPAMRFPCLKKKTKDRLRCTYTTGAVPVRVEGPRVIVLPGVRQVRTAENIRALWRHVRRGTGRLLSATIREKAGRWSVSLKLEITRTTATGPPHQHRRCRRGYREQPADCDAPGRVRS